MSDQSRRDVWPPDWPDITDPVVLRAIATVPRHLFVPPSRRADAYSDAPQPIGYGQTISQPYVVALMTQALALRPESRVLEIGTGSGYQSAVLASITPHVWSVERLPELATAARERLQGLGYAVEVLNGDGCLGWPEYAPYDGVIVTAAGSEVPPALAAQLADGGRLVIPLGANPQNQVLWLIERRHSVLTGHVLADVRFVPLVVECDEPRPEDTTLIALQRQLRALVSVGRF